MIHDLAHINPEARIGKNVTIGPFTTVAKDVVIGDGTWIGPNATIMDGARIGKNCKIFPGAVVSGIPQDLKFVGEITTLEVGDNTIIRECVTLNRGTKAKNKTVIGNNCLIMAYTHVAHDCIIGNNCILVNNVALAGEVVIHDFAILAGHTLVHQFVHIGAYVMIGGGGKVRIDVPPYIKADREPLSYVGVNSIGLRRRGFSNEKINEIQDIYRILYLQNLNNSQALIEIEKKIPSSPERDEIMDFFRKSTRGVIRSS
jgi:UDP-N-acetylglucosamine acyltransferase